MQETLIILSVFGLTALAIALIKLVYFPAIIDRRPSDVDDVLTAKKQPSADLQNYKWMFLLLGLAISLTFTRLIIEWSSEYINWGDLSRVPAPPPEEEFLEIPITEIPPPPPPVVRVPIFEEVPDEEEIEIPEIVFEEEEIDTTEVVEVFEDFEEIEEEVIDDTPIDYNLIGQKPVFPGGENGLIKYIADNYRYPHRDREEGNEGRIYVKFTIGKDGSVEDAQILRGINSRMDEEAIRVINTLPKWTPGKNAGSPVRVTFTMPIKLTLE